MTPARPTRNMDARAGTAPVTARYPDARIYS